MRAQLLPLVAIAAIALAAVPVAGQTVATTPAAAPARTSLFPSDEQIRERLRGIVERGEARGVVVGLIEADGRRRIIALGDAGEGAVPLGPESVFEIGSINKTFTGAILADMVLRGEVSLDDPVARYLPPQVRVPSRGGRQITLLDLATHTSGLPRLPTGYTPPDPTNPYAHFEVEQLYAFLSSHALERDIGGEPLYSNLGMGLLGHALARAAGAESFPALVRDRILRPLGMSMTGYGRPEPLARAFTRGHDADGRAVPYWDVAVLAGAGGLNSNIEDMLAYLAANLGEPASPIEQAMRDAHRPRRPGPVPGSALGLAWATRERGGETIVGHGGGTAGYSTYIGFNPERRAGVVVLANTGGFDADGLGRELLDPNSRVEIALPADRLDDYVGTYRLRPDFDIAVTIDNGRLYAQATGQPRLAIFPEAADRFFLRVVDAQLTFSRDGAGAVTGLTLHQNGNNVSGQRVD